MRCARSRPELRLQQGRSARRRQQRAHRHHALAFGHHQHQVDLGLAQLQLGAATPEWTGQFCRARRLPARLHARIGQPVGEQGIDPVRGFVLHRRTN